MRRLLFGLFFSLSAFAALPTAIMWNVAKDTGAADTNGGGVEFLSTNLPAIQSSTGTPIVLTFVNAAAIAGYTTGDNICVFSHLVNTNANGCWFNVTVSGATITLTGSVATGSNGGATGAVLEAFNLLAAPKFSGAATGAVTASVLSDSVHNFALIDRRNLVYISACTGGAGTLVPGWYNITTTAANAATLGSDPGGVLTGCTWYEGGALLSPGTVLAAGSPLTAQSKVFIKYAATAYAIAAGLVIPVGGTPTPNPVEVIGYYSVLADAFTIGYANRPTIQISAGNAGVTMISGTQNGAWVMNLILDCNSQTTSAGLNISGDYGFVYNVKAIGCASFGLRGKSSDSHAVGNEVTALTSAATYGISNFLVMARNWVHDTAGAAGFAAFQLTALNVTVRNVVTNLTAGGSCAACDGFQIPSGAFNAHVISNTIYNVSRDGIAVLSGSAYSSSLTFNNVVVSSGRYGYNGNAVPRSPYMDGNCIQGSGTADYINENLTTTIAGAGFYPYRFNVTPAAIPFVNAAGNDFRLASGSTCTGAGLNGPLPTGIVAGSSDFGALGRAGGFASAFSQ